jgi:hypothetical protein
LAPEFYVGAEFTPDIDVVTIRSHRMPRKRYGQGRWRKRKGFAEIRLQSGEIVRAELHWYEATGIGRREMKIKAFI